MYIEVNYHILLQVPTGTAKFSDATVFGRQILDQTTSVMNSMNSSLRGR